MVFSISNNILWGAHQLESPNQSHRPDDSEIDMLVIHNISLPPGEYGTDCVSQLFCNKLNPDSHPAFKEIADLRVSAHLLISRNGRVVQYVPFNKKAWHAGESIFCGKSNCNEFSIGIELEGTDFEIFTDDQYETLIDITQLLLNDFPCLSLDRIVGHSDIAPGRKTDPGPFFDWARYRAAIHEAGH
ncbi:MAG: 1,6-anhydro-N-acetylmuramyl-L-alanine amidase AmpD [SAR86 cluster bacterium]|uniref:1,6-anhydro-N-acetylmuramyl-L-alanine amidase AmpD n=1 Tax=SAR86 cluster bacterium TaxID=2030880 RepID=A0A2A5AZF3_9GAMM|nr:MAG: 1,6-anhydro-N-acetylmuramyl-L-alanine amidase AmpD [SAR86 cluster bacterium]